MRGKGNNHGKYFRKKRDELEQDRKTCTLYCEHRVLSPTPTLYIDRGTAIKWDETNLNLANKTN